MPSLESWHALPYRSVAETLHTGVETGLSPEEARRRLGEGGNRMPEPERDGFLTRLGKQLASPITLVLIAAMVATSLLGHVTDAAVIFVALLVNIVMGMVQEGRASQAFEALKKGEARHAVVFRDGEPYKIPVEEVVQGDLIALSTGNAVPADIRLTEVHGLLINEAALSGEWMAVEKSADETAEDASLADRVSMAYAGTLVAAGAGKGIVIAVGKDTELGKIAAELGKRDTAVTPLMRDIQQVARLILVFVIIVLAAIITLGLLRGLPLDETIFTAIALAVASVPEGLPAAVTVVLALGMERILKSGGLVRNLLAAETLGTTSIILTDKTGTITEGRMTLESFVGMTNMSADAQDPEAHALLTGAVLASNAYIEEREDAPEGERFVVHGRPIEQAVVSSGLRNGIEQHLLIRERRRTDELHFDSSRRFGGMIVTEGEGQTAYFTGAPELFLSALSRVQDGEGNAHPISDEVRAHFERALSIAARDGKRVIAVARRSGAPERFPKEEAMLEFLTQGALLGFMVFSDVIRSEVKAAVRDMHEAGARVLMLTGDNPETAFAIAQEVGIAGPDESRAYTGAELAALSDEELLQVLNTHSVYARVAPAEKLRMANVLKDAGEVVAMTGDGVNDAPALRAAAIGVAVGSGTDVAKEASDLVLLDNGFSVITAAIREGRRLRDNFKKIFAYMLSTNFSEVVLITFALVFGLPLPILPTQVLWSNLIEGGLMNFAFAFEPLYPASMKRSPKDPEIARVLSPKLIKLIVLVGSITAAMLIAVYLYVVAIGLPVNEIQTLMFIAVSVNCIFMAFSMKSFSTPLWKLSLLSNKFLLVSLLGSALLLLAALYLPPLQALVHVTEPTLLQLGVLVGFGILNLATIEFAKWFLFIRPAARSAILPA